MQAYNWERSQNGPPTLGRFIEGNGVDEMALSSWELDTRTFRLPESSRGKNGPHAEW
jgi:hypothetical protein